MKFAPICPIPLMRPYANSDYHMALAHLMQDPNYSEFFWKRSGFKILDNSVIELKHAMPSSELVKLALDWDFDEVIIPDVPMDIERTLACMRRFFDENHQPPIRRMGVPQGSTIEEWFECLHYMVNKYPLDTIGIPKNLDKLGPGTRINVCYLLESLGAGVGIPPLPLGRFDYHLLGIYNNPVELASLHQFEWIRGCDSVLPIWLGQHGVRLHPTRGLLIDRPQVEIDFTDGRDPFPHDIAWNLATVKRWASGT